MSKTNAFQPDWFSAPGDTIADILEERNLPPSEFAQLLGQSLESANALLQGRATITIGIARKLSMILGASVEFWMSRDFQYREDIARLHGDEERWIAELPLGDMIKFGWLSPVPHPSDEVAACLRFFNVPSVRAWHEAYASLQEMAVFRTSPSFDSRPAAAAAWLRQGEIEGNAIECNPWSPDRFRSSLSSIRPLTREKDPSIFIPTLQRICAENGVAVGVIRSPAGCRASGATRFLSPDKALLLLSFRHLSDDHFWFTFFHEAGHLLLHGDKCLFLESADTPSTKEEQEANEFAALSLIPPEFQHELLSLPADSRKIIKFARSVGISPGIVVGQLQHLGRLRHHQMNRLKRRFTWEG